MQRDTYAPFGRFAQDDNFYLGPAGCPNTCGFIASGSPASLLAGVDVWAFAREREP